MPLFTIVREFTLMWSRLGVGKLTLFEAPNWSFEEVLLRACTFQGCSFLSSLNLESCRERFWKLVTLQDGSACKVTSLVDGAISLPVYKICLPACKISLPVFKLTIAPFLVRLFFMTWCCSHSVLNAALNAVTDSEA